MKLSRLVAFALPLTGLTFLDAHDASACGGCFVPPTESTQVTGHRMVLSVASDRTTLWDQIEYAGNPESFAWVLPTKGVVDVGISSDVLFATLEYNTQVSVIPPYLSCPNSCGYGYGEDGAMGAGSSTSTGGGDAGVTVVAQEVVGPYETVQLASTDPTALHTWLADHGYDIPADINPIIDAYVNEGFNFLALKLVPGQGVESMKPVRVTTPGAAPALPLRMGAAGTGAKTPITLWVLGEGRYAPANFPEFVIHKEQLVWDWDTSSSNYSELRQTGFDATNGKGWLMQAAEPSSKYAIDGIIMPLVENMPELSGYGDATGQGAYDEAVADLDALYGSLDPNALWVMRMNAELPRAALATDLSIAASSDQTPVTRTFYVDQTVGDEPVCPPDPCAGNTPGGVPWLPGTDPWGWGSGSGGQKMTAGGGGCAMGGGAGLPALGGLALAAALGLARRRRSRK